MKGTDLRTVQHAYLESFLRELGPDLDEEYDEELATQATMTARVLRTVGVIPET